MKLVEYGGTGQPSTEVTVVSVQFPEYLLKERNRVAGFSVLECRVQPSWKIQDLLPFCGSHVQGDFWKTFGTQS
jgi:hypothetical protein